MKLLITKQISAIFFLLTILILFSTSNTGYAQAATIDPPLNERTPQIRDAIVAAVPGVNAAADVTAAHLAAITRLRLRQKNITSLKSGDFNGLTSLTDLNLWKNSISDISALAGLTSLTELYLGDNSVSDISALDDLTSLTYLYLAGTSISNISALDDLTNLIHLDLQGTSISDISALDDLTSLTELYLSNTSISNISALDDLTNLKWLFLKGTSISDISALEHLTSLTYLELSGNPISDYGPLRRLIAAIAGIEDHPGLKLDINIPPVFTDGSTTTRSVAENTASGISIGAAVAATDVDSGDTLTYSLGGTDAASFSINSTTGQLQTSAALDYETKPSYSVSVSVSDGKGGSDSIPVTIGVSNVNEAPSFTDGSSATRTIAENTAANTNIGSAVAATDVDANTTLTYTLGGTDAASFSINSSTGQLQTKAALDYETKTSYSVRITVSDSKLTASIDVTINVTDVDENRAPVFTDGTSTTRSVAENTAASTNIGAAIAATDADTSDTLTYTLSGEDASSFSIVDTSGQLQTKAALDYETDASYSVTVSVSDGEGGSDSITVTINVTDVNEAPTFSAGAAINNISATAGTAITSVTLPEATDVDGNTLTYSLSPTPPTGLSFTAGTRVFGGTPTTETASATYTYTASDDTLSATLTFTIQVSAAPNNAPSFADGTSTTRSIAENTGSGQNIGTAISATDADTDDTLTYSLGGADAASFSIDTSTGRLQTKAALDYETDASYSVTVSVSDGEGGSDSITVTINVTDVNEAPTFSAGAAINNISATAGTAITSVTLPEATDVDGNTLTYSLSPTPPTGLSFTAETRLLAGTPTTETASATYTYTASDDTLSATLTFTIQVSAAPNNAPAFADGNTTTRSIAENTASGINIGAAVAATDADTGNTLTYTLSGEDAASFSIDSESGQLQTKAALDYETDASYSVTVSVSDGEGGSDSITVTINVTDVNEAPTFSAGAAINNISATAGTAITSVTLPEATDVDGNTLTYSLSPTPPTGLSFTAGTRVFAGTPTTETASATYTYTASDDTLSATLTFTIQVSAAPNNAPVFTDGDTTTRSIAENTASGINIGAAVAATDADTDDTLTYVLGGTDASSFSIDSESGQLQTKAALDYETDASYSVTVSVSDGEGGSDSITVTINVTDVNEAPTFSAGAAINNISATAGTAITSVTLPEATDVDGNTLTYSLSPTPPTGLSFTAGTRVFGGTPTTETASATYTYTASDDTLSATLTFTIQVSAAPNNAPVFTDGTSTTRSVAENTAASTNIGAAIAATDADTSDTLTYTLSGEDAASFSIDSESGQLQTKAALDYETDVSYSVTVSVSDGEGGSDSITVTINVTDVNEAPTFSAGAAINNISATAGTAITSVTLPEATDVDGNTLTYSLSPTPPTGLSFTAGTRVFGGTPTTETASATYTYTASDDTLSATLTFTIQVSAAPNNAPAFADGSSATRSVAENTGSGQNIGTAISATDADTDDTLTYSLGGTDAAMFSINSATGQLRTKAALDYEAKVSYSVRITVSDSKLTASIDVTINVTDVDENRAPSFADGSSATRSVAENTGSGQNIGTAISATDADTDDTLTYSLGGTDAAMFSINSATGQLRTKAALDYEAKVSYSVRITVSDSKLTASIDVTINVTDVDENRAPVFADGSTATRSVAENTASDQDIGSAVAATDPDTGDTLTYTLGGTDTSSFSINSRTGQLQTKAALDYETKTSYAVTITVSDSKLIDSIDVTINVSNVNEAPSFTEGSSATRAIAENTASGQNIGSAVAATDVDADTTLTYKLGRTDAWLFSINSRTGQLRTRAALNYETKTSYPVTITVSDGKLTDSIAVTINVTDVYEPIIHRTQQVQDAIVAAVPGVNHPDYVTVAHLWAITGLNISSKSITSLKSSDFSGLTALTHLYLKDNLISDISAPKGLTTLTHLELSNNLISDISVLKGLTALTHLYLSNNSVSDISALTGLTALTTLDLEDNSVSDISALTGLTKLTTLYLSNNSISDISALTGLTKLTYLNLSNNSISNISALTGLTALTSLYLRENSISDISALTGLTALTRLDLEDNSVSDISALTGLTALTHLYLSNNSVSDISALKGLTALTDLELNGNSVSDISALTGLTALTYLDLRENSVSDISALTGLTALTYLNLSNNSVSDISALTGLTKLTNLYLSGNPISDYDPLHRLIAAIAAIEDHPGLTFDINIPPGFTDGTSTTRSVAEYTASGQDIGDPVSATDVDSETLTYSLGGTDAASFSIDTATGQLQTKAALHYETKASYTVTVSAADSNGGTDTITVTINVTDVDKNRAPAFINGDTTTRSVAENTASGQNIGTPVTATDADRNTLTYSLGGTDAQSFTINTSSGQLQTSAALDYEKKTSYSVSVSVSDGTLKDRITVTIKVIDVNETLTTPVNQRTQQVQNAIINAAGVDNADDVTPAHLAAITELYLSYDNITSLKSGDFSGLTALTTLYLSGNSISDISALKGLTKLTTLYLYGNSISDVSALKGLTKLTTLYLTRNPISDYGPLRKLMAAIAGIEDHPGLTLDINIPPEFTDGTSTTRSVAEYTPSGQDIGAAVAATDANKDDYLSYSLGGTDADSFSIDSESGQLQTSAALNYQTKTSYSVTVSVSDGNGGTDSIAVTINVTDVDEALITAVNQRTQQVRDAIFNAVWDVDNIDDVTPAHLAAITELDLSNWEITSLKSGDFSGLTFMTDLDLSGNSISNISALRGLKKLTDLDLSDNSISDVSALGGLTALTDLDLSDNSISNIWHLRGLTALTNLDLSDNSIRYISALERLTKLTYLYLEGNRISDYGPLRRLVAAIAGIEGHPGLTLDINIPPVFTEGTRTTRYVAEYTATNTNIGAPVAATDANSSDYLSYSLGGTDADSFNIDSSSGQLQTSAALNYQTKRSYSVTVSVSDGNEGTDSIAVTIRVTDVNESLITAVNQRTQQVQDAIVAAVPGVDNAEDVTPGHLGAITSLRLNRKDIASLKSGDFSGLISLTDLDLSYNSISDISALRGLISLTNLDLRDNSISDISALEGLTKLTNLYLQDNPISDYAPLRRLKTAIENAGNAIYIDIDITNNPPQFADGDSTTRSVSENMPSDTNIGAAISATDADNDTLTYSLGGTNADTFAINSESGQLHTTTVLDYETKTSYSVTVSVSDGNDGKGSITVTINVSDVDETLITPVNQRTQQVQDVIVDALPGVDNADDVTPAHLPEITELNFTRKYITSLKSGDFSGLTGLTELDLSYQSSLSDISALEGLMALTTLNLTGNLISDISALEDLTKLTTLDLSYNSISDISALEDLTKLTTLNLSSNSISDVSALEDLTKLTTLYVSENPISDYAPLRRLKTAIENADNFISIDIDMTNNPPVFADGDSTTRSIQENTASGTNIGNPISATDADTDSLAYYFASRLGGSDAEFFDIDYDSGQLSTIADLDYETKTSYTVIVDVSDGNDGLDRITVTINVTDVAGAAPSVETAPIIPDKTELLTNFPNPFNPETWIPYQLAKPADVTLTIYDIRGVVVRELKLGHQAAGMYHSRSRAIHWDGRNAFGEKVATGVYFYTLQAGDFTATRKLLIRK